MPDPEAPAVEPEAPPSSDAPPAPRPAPKEGRFRFRCPSPSCGKTFVRHTRTGIWSTCPKCGARAYGEAVYRDLASAAAQGSPPAPKRRGQRSRIAVVGGSAAHDSQPAGAPASATNGARSTQPAPAPAAPAPSLWARILGQGEL